MMKREEFPETDDHVSVNSACSSDKSPAAVTHEQDIKSSFELFIQDEVQKFFWIALIWREGMFNERGKETDPNYLLAGIF